MGIERAWEVLTAPECVAQWLGCLNYAAEPGHVFHMQQDDTKRAAGDLTGAIHCEILELTRHERFVFSWYFPGVPKTTVSIALRSLAADRTEPALVHDGWDQFAADDIRAIRDQLANGWQSHVLPAFAAVATRGSGG